MRINMKIFVPTVLVMVFVVFFAWGIFTDMAFEELAFKGRVEQIKTFSRHYEINVGKEWYELKSKYFTTFIRYVVVGDSVSKSRGMSAIEVFRKKDDGTMQKKVFGKNAK